MLLAGDTMFWQCTNRWNQALFGLRRLRSARQNSSSTSSKIEYPRLERAQVFHLIATRFQLPNWYPNAHLCSNAGCRGHGETSGDRLGTLLHDFEPKVAVFVVRKSKAGPIITDNGLDAAVNSIHDNGDMLRRGVFADIVEGFLHHAKH